MAHVNVAEPDKLSELPSTEADVDAFSTILLRVRHPGLRTAVPNIGFKV